MQTTYKPHAILGIHSPDLLGYIASHISPQPTAINLMTAIYFCMISCDKIHVIFLSDFKVCSFREGSCEVRYTIGVDLTGDEDMFHVVMDEGQSSVSTLRRGNSNCIPRQEIWPIFVGIILGIIVVGLLAVILWRCCTYIGVSLARLLRKQNLKWHG